MLYVTKHQAALQICTLDQVNTAIAKHFTSIYIYILLTIDGAYLLVSYQTDGIYMASYVYCFTWREDVHKLSEDYVNNILILFQT